MRRPDRGNHREALTGLDSLELVRFVFRVLPGFAAWARGDRERGLVFMVSFATAWLIAVFAWGSKLGFLMLVFGFGTHVVAWVDQIRRRAFVPMGRWAPWLATSMALGLIIYGPIVLLAACLAWPGVNGSKSAEVFLVNSRAYLEAEPGIGDWVWYQSTPLGESRVGKVVANRGQEVEWTGNQLKVAGCPSWLGTPFRSPTVPREFHYKIPDGQVLVNPSAETGVERLNNLEAEGLIVVDRDLILGRPWAKFYPINERRWLQ